MHSIIWASFSSAAFPPSYTQRSCWLPLSAIVVETCQRPAGPSSSMLSAWTRRLSGSTGSRPGVRRISPWRRLSSASRVACARVRCGRRRIRAELPARGRRLRKCARGDLSGRATRRQARPRRRARRGTAQSVGR